MPLLRYLKLRWKLRSADRATQLEAAVELSANGHDGARAVLRGMLFQQEETQRIEALEAVSSAPPSEWSIAQLAELLCDASPRVAGAAAAALERHPIVTFEVLSGWFEDWRTRIAPIGAAQSGFSARAVLVEPLLSAIAGADASASPLERALPILERCGWKPTSPLAQAVRHVVE